jgi:hypothetical protein
MKIWYAYAEENEEELVNQLLLENKVKSLQGEYDYLFTLNPENIKIVFYDGVDILFYVLNGEEDCDCLLLMFRDDIRLMDSFHNDLFYQDFDAWLEKVKGLNEVNKKYIH